MNDKTLPQDNYPQDAGSAALKSVPKRTVRVIHPLALHFNKLFKGALADILNGQNEGFVLVDHCLDTSFPDDLQGTELQAFLLELRDQYLGLMRRNVHIKQCHRINLKQCFITLFRIIDDILSQRNEEEKHFLLRQKEIQSTYKTIKRLAKHCTHTIGDKSFSDLLDETEKVNSALKSELHKADQVSEVPDKALAELLIQTPTSTLSRYERLCQIREQGSEREAMLAERSSGLAENYGRLLEQYSQTLIDNHLDPKAKLSEYLESYLNEGLFSKELCEEHHSNSQRDLPNWKATELNHAHSERHTYFTYVTQWIELEVQNALELPYWKVQDKSIQLYKKVLKHYLEAFHQQEQQILEKLRTYSGQEKTKSEIKLLQDMLYHTTSYEYALGKGRSVNSVQKIREYTHLKSIQQKVLVELISAFGELDMGSVFANYIKKQQHHLRLLMIIRHRLQVQLQKTQRYIQEEIPRLKQKALDANHPQSLIYRLQQMLIEARQNLETQGPSTCFLPIQQDGEGKLSMQEVREGIAKLECYFPIFKKPLGSLKHPDPKDFNLSDYIFDENEKGFEQKLYEMEEQLKGYQLHTRETRILLLPSKGLGSYDICTNTIIVPLISSGQHRLEGLYRAVASFLYRTRIQNNASATKELSDILVSRYPMIRKRKHTERILVNIFCKHLMEVTGIIHTSGHTQKEKKFIVSHLDHPNNLIQCREIINIQKDERESRLDMIKKDLGIHKLEHITAQIIQHLDPQNIHTEYSHIEPTKFISVILKDQPAKTKLALAERLFDLGVICFHKYLHYPATEAFLILSHLTPESQEVWWNISTILNYYPFEGYVNLVKDRKKAAQHTYRQFELCDGVSEYWIKKSRALRQELELKKL